MPEAGPLELFGTEEPVPERRLLRAGKLTAILEEGNLRYIAFDGVEIVRAVNYLARDASWGTLRATLADVEISESEQRFDVSFTGLCGAPEAGFRYRMRTEGTANGHLEMRAEGKALGDFLTNRTGFVILHPSDVAGGSLIIEHGDGSLQTTSFPARISADQPAFDIVALTHRPVPGMTCTARFKGEVFEMEDQRNWSDASFKTYVRPLSKPRPYLIAKGDRDVQSVILTVEGSAAKRSGKSEEVAEIVVGAPAGKMPAIAIFVDEAEIGATRPAPGLAQYIVARLDAYSPDRLALQDTGRFAKACDAELAVEIICDLLDPDAESAAALRLMREAGVDPAVLLCSPRREFKTRPSGTLPNGEQPVGAIVAALRKAGFQGRIGSGTPSNFTEFNRNPPDLGADLTYFSVGANVHAADDISVMETLEVYPDLIASARALVPDTPIWLGPCTIGVRHNPYGAAVQPNPLNRRVAAARIDPRHGALFGAAFAIGVAERAAAAGAEVLTLGALSGELGLFDNRGNERPVGRISRELSRASGAAYLPLSISDAALGGVGFETSSGARLLICNKSPDMRTLAMPAGFERVERIRSGRTEMTAVESRRLKMPPFSSFVLRG